jgi:hypothetical protein
MRFAAMQGFNSGTQFFDYLKDAFDVLYAEGDPNGLNQPKMLSIGLHCRLVGRPARAAALARFLDYVQRITTSGSRAASISPSTGKSPPVRRRLKILQFGYIKDIQKIIRGRSPDDNPLMLVQIRGDMSTPIRFFFRGAVHEVEERRADAHRAAAPARRPALHRHQGRLRRRRLRRLHGGGRIAGTGRAATEGGEFLHPVHAHARRQGPVHGGRPAAARRRAAPGAAGAGRMPRLAMRLLHARLRDVAVGHVPEAGGPGAEPLPDRRCAVRQPVPLHRLPSDHRCRAPHGELPRVDFDRAAVATSCARCSARPAPSYSFKGQTFHAPRTSTNWWRCAPPHPQAVLLAGSTDVGLWVTKQMRELPTSSTSATSPN